MSDKRIYLSFALMVLSFSFACASNVHETAQQQISDFSLSGYGDKGKKSWDISGKNADIVNEVVKLKDVSGNLYDRDRKSVV